MDIKTDNIFEKSNKNQIEQEIITKEDLYKVEELDLFKNINEINENSINLEKEGEIINKQDFEEDIKERDIILNDILEDLNKNVLINIKNQEEDSKQKAIKELLEILKYPHSDKDIRMGISPFKPLLQPKKVSMVGRVFYNSADKDNNNNINSDSTKDTTNTSNNNIGIFKQ